jgi:hypothetical protein
MLAQASAPRYLGFQGMKNSISAYLSERVTIRTKARADCPKKGLNTGAFFNLNNAT